MACYLICPIQSQSQGRPSGPATPAGPTVIKIPNGLVGIVIGKSGETIKALQAKTGARIQISKEIIGPERDVTLIGGPSEIAAVRAEIDMLLSQARSNNNNNNYKRCDRNSPLPQFDESQIQQ